MLRLIIFLVQMGRGLSTSAWGALSDGTGLGRLDPHIQQDSVKCSFIFRLSGAAILSVTARRSQRTYCDTESLSLVAFGAPFHPSCLIRTRRKSVAGDGVRRQDGTAGQLDADSIRGDTHYKSPNIDKKWRTKKRQKTGELFLLHSSLIKF